MLEVDLGVPIEEPRSTLERHGDEGAVRVVRDPAQLCGSEAADLQGALQVVRYENIGVDLAAGEQDLGSGPCVAGIVDVVDQRDSPRKGPAVLLLDPGEHTQGDGLPVRPFEAVDHEVDLRWHRSPFSA